ncbi:MAG: LamG domain-containing protein, partial [Planctomycetota bacterium]
MCRKSSLLTCVVLVLGLACSASGAVQWTDAGDGNSWCNPDNWRNPSVVPGPSDKALIRLQYTGFPGPVEDGPIMDCDVDVGSIEGPYKGQDVNITTDGTVNIAGDWKWEDVYNGTSNIFIPGSPTMTIGGEWWIAQSQGSKCILTITGNPTITVGTDMRTAGPDRISCRFTMNMSNGSLDVAGRFTWESGGGALNVSGGTIDCNELVYRGPHGKPWTLNLDGGTITVADQFTAPEEPEGANDVTINLDAGTLECGSFDHNSQPYAMDINEGEFIIDGNVVADISADVDANYITAFDGTRDVIVTYDEGSNKTTVRADYVKVKASDPSPGNYAQNQCPGVELSWTPGAYAVDHNVYFGPSLSDVNGSKDPCLVRYGEPNWAPPDLELGRTYYWRVDEVNDACDDSPWAGDPDPWQFTTEDGNARDPDPLSGRRYLSLSENLLTWTPSCVATSQNVYFSTDFNDVNELQGTYYALSAADNNITPALEKSTTYYWRVKTIGGGDGKIWNFSTGFGVIMYYKFDGSQGAPLPSTVTDDSGNGIEFTKYTSDAGSVVYGESNPVYNSEEGASADFDPCSGLFRLDTGGNDPLRLAGPQYTIEMWLRPDVLDSDTDIVLIDKRNSWQIKINDPEADPEENGNEYTWVHADNSEDMGENSAVEGEWAHLGFVYNYYDPDNNRMKLYLDGVLVSDESEDRLNPSDNNDMVTIAMQQDYYAGAPTGGYEYFFDGLIDEIRIQDIALTPAKFLLTPGPEWASNPRPGNKVRDIDPNDANLALVWDPGTKVVQHRVYFSTDFEDVNSGSLDALRDTLPAESNSWPTVGNLADYLAAGTIYYWKIDEVNETTVWEGVLWKFVTKYEIIDPHLKVWYPLDEESGKDAYDTSGHSKHGDLDIEDDLPSPNWEPEGGQFGGCLVFNNDTAIEPPQDTLPSLADSGITVAMWLNGLTTQDPEKNMWVLDGGTDDHRLTVIVPNIEAKVIWRAGNDSNDYLEWDVDTSSWQGDWHHLAFVKDEAAEKMYIYLDGDLGWWKPGTDPTITNLANKQLRIGARETSSNNYQGKVDDFRIYDIALSETSIEELVRGGDLASAWGPSPYDGQADAPRDANLVWNAGNYADSHDVYFGTDYTAVRDANTSATYGVFRGNQTETVNDIDILTLDTWYFWRIDEVNDACDASPWTGKVWKFKVADY